MDDYSLVPVDHQPDFENVSLVPVDYDPYAAAGVAPPVPIQPQPAQNQPTANGPDPAQTSGPAVSAPTAAASDPVQPNNPSPAPTSSSGPPTLANQQQPGDVSAVGPGSGGLVPAKIAELGSDFYNQSILKPLRDLRAMGHDLITDPAYFLHAVGPSLVGLGMSAPAARVGSVGVAERAKEIHNVLDAIARRMRTTAVLETDAGRIVAGGSRDLSPLQRAALGRGEIAAKAPRTHAEATALKKAASIGATPSELAVTRTICPKCAALVESFGGKLTSRTTAVFPRR